jgi:hypothetical protein
MSLQDDQQQNIQMQLDFSSALMAAVENTAPSPGGITGTGGARAAGQPYSG